MASGIDAARLCHALKLKHASRRRKQSGQEQESLEMSEAVFQTVHRDGLALLTINRPEAMNALSSEVRNRLADAIAAANADPEVGAIVLTGAGDRAFSAGLDLKELAQSQGAVALAVSEDRRFNPAVAIESSRIPVIGAINGMAITGGLELALSCDILIASTNARFADTHVKAQLMPGWGLSQKLSRIIGPSRAKEMSLGSGFIDAETALAWGLVNRIVPHENLLDTACALGKAIAANSKDMVCEYKALIDDGFLMPLADALAFERRASIAFNKNVRAEDIAGRRASVQDSNRKNQSQA